MVKLKQTLALFALLNAGTLHPTASVAQTGGSRAFNAPYQHEYLDRVAFPIGGIGSGMFCLEGTGAISHVSLRHHPDVMNEPYAFAALCVKGIENGAKVLEGQVPTWKLFGPNQSGLGRGDKTYGLPRFEEAVFQTRFPFATIDLRDDDMPVEVKITGWSPFIPTDADNSSLPVGVLEYQFTNTSQKAIETVFSYNTRNFIDGQGSIQSIKNGVVLASSRKQDGLAIYVDNDAAVVDHCWFRGGWFDPQTVVWDNIRYGKITNNQPVKGAVPGASVYVPLALKPGETKIVKVNFCWYLPESNLSFGGARKSGEAFAGAPSKGTASGQQTVSGFVGRQLLNSFDNGGDGLTGIIQSPEFNIGKRYLKFLVGGGNQTDRTSVNLVVDGKIVETAVGRQTETLSEVVWDLKPYQGKKAFVKIIDLDVYPWGHVLADQFVLTNNREEDLYDISSTATLLADFEGATWGDWQVMDSSEEEKKFLPEEEGVEATYRPWYSERFKSLSEVVGYWEANDDMLRKNSQLFSDAFYSSTLPAEVLEAVAANLTILKSPTVLRQWDGRFWAWEGCQDSFGSCHGSCTHVWNYAQALPHLFPSLERTLRETEFNVAQNSEGHQNFRVNLPISAPPHNFHAAADGQLGGIMKVYREWRISGDTQWMKSLFPLVKKSLDYCIRTWDPLRKGYLEEPHHNTYDIEFWGPDGMCTSFYLGALTAYIEMGKALKEPVKEYAALLAKGKKYMETSLFDGEYFIQKIQWEGLQAPNPVDVMSFGGNYSDEAVKLLKEEGPKYQYGSGCLSDGILGMWMASVCGLDEVLDNAKVKSHLVAVHKYNLKDNLIDHFNPQRPSYACGSEGGLLLCTWPKGGMLSLPFVYSNEVWTGIEYQVASHLMLKGEVEKGLDIVRECRERYDGRVRNPFNEIECGHWYARAMASYGMLQGLTGVRYDAVDKTMYIDSKVGDFKSFISTNTGFGTIEWKQGKPSLEVVYGTIDVKQYNVSGKLIKK
ncbi:MAG: GH116 family glycosyl hydrolase [Bacteroides sp.]|uniref:GH116 family glycosyl hydrolase n=1 Tax=Bacteroides sp. TaxID=29523 RepID=UPI0026E07519|nr:GH116 family glycosyl hydrolase [Bacteroides sp.]MDO5420878.1 GH116 family glycosyl hydrolase [Bacteroides sp.]